jgi:hypothetical protein
LDEDDENGFRTLADCADDPQARPGTDAALVLPQPVPGVTRPDVRRLRGILKPGASLKRVRLSS